MPEELSQGCVYAIYHNLRCINGRPTTDGNEDDRIHVFKSLDSVDDTLNGRMLTDLRKLSAERTPCPSRCSPKTTVVSQFALFPKGLASGSPMPFYHPGVAEEVPF